MNTSRPVPAFCLLLITAFTSNSLAVVTLDVTNSFLVNNASEPGTLVVSGDLSVAGAMDYGVSAGTPTLSAVLLDWISGSKTATSDLTDSGGAFQWRDNLAGGSSVRTKMRLDENNSLSIYNSSGSAAGITLNGQTGVIDAASVNVSNSPVITASNLGSSIQQLPNLQVSGMISNPDWSGGMELGPGTNASGTSLAVGFNTIALSQGSLALGWGVQATGERSVALGHGTQAIGYESIASGRGTAANGALNFVGGWYSQSFNYNSFAYGHYCTANSQATGAGAGYDSDAFAIAMGSYSGATAPHSTAIGFGSQASAQGSAAIGNAAVSNTPYEFTLGSWPNVSPSSTAWNETDAAFRVGNGSGMRSDAITTLKNGQTTLTNKAWKQDPGVVPNTSNSNGEALVVEGNTRLKGDVVLERPQGDISMGIYE